MPETVSPIATHTVLSTSVNPVMVGQPVTLTSYIYGSTTSGTSNSNPVPAGETVQFYDGSTLLGTATTGSGGMAQLQVPGGFTTAGSHLLQAVYGGDGTLGGIRLPR